MDVKQFLIHKGIFDTQYIVDTDGESINIETLLTEYHTLQLQQTGVRGCFSSLEKCENEAILFTKDKLKVVSGLLSEDYKIGYKEGVQHYLASKNNL